MAFDATRHAGAITRTVRSREWNGQPARVVIAERSYRGAPAEVWDALTRAERIERWLMPISGDLRLGGRYQLDGNAGGTIEQCEPPRRLQVTWEFGGGLSWVIVTLESEGEEATRLTLEHIALEDAQFLGFWDQFGPGAVGVGWDLSLLGLALHLSPEGPSHPREEAEWLATGDGKAFAAASSASWAEASIAHGTDAGAAREAAGRTTAFYLGTGEGGDGIKDA